MNKLTLNEYSKRKLDETYLVIYAIKNEINMKKVIYILLLVLILEVFKNKYEKEHKRIVKKSEEFMKYLEPLFELPQEIRKCIYTSNAIETVNSALRKVTKGKGSFPNEISLYKILFLRIKEVSKKWKKPIQNWKIIQAQLINLFGNRYNQYLDL